MQPETAPMEIQWRCKTSRAFINARVYYTLQNKSIFPMCSAHPLGSSVYGYALREPLLVVGYSEVSGLSNLFYLSFKLSQSAELDYVAKFIFLETSLIKTFILFSSFLLVFHLSLISAFSSLVFFFPCLPYVSLLSSMAPRPSPAQVEVWGPYPGWQAS